MPKRKRRPAKPKSKPKGPINWAPWLWGALAVNVAAGVIFSPITAPVKVRAVGVNEQQRVQAEEILNRWQNRPAVLIPKDEVASQLLEVSSIKSAQVRLNILGRGVVRVEAKRPVAVLVGSDKALADDGSIAYFANLPPNLPSLTLREELLEPEPALIPGWEAAQTAQFCEEISRGLPKEPWQVEVDLRGVLFLRLPEKKGVVIFGTPTRIVEKVNDFREALAEKPELMDDYSELNFSAPGQGTVKP